MFVGPEQWPGVDLPPSEEQELVEMHSPVGLLSPIVHVLLELEGICGEEVQHFEAVSPCHVTGQIQRGLPGRP